MNQPRISQPQQSYISDSLMTSLDSFKSLHFYLFFALLFCFEPTVCNGRTDTSAKHLHIFLSNPRCYRQKQTPSPISTKGIIETFLENVPYI